ncbi:MAG: hypothetical protein AAF492_31325 [Verrucomicrobiota bacterium]
MAEHTKLEQALENLYDALKSLVTLRVVTAVGAVDTRDEKNYQLKQDPPPIVMFSELDMIQGVSRLVVDEELMKDEYESIRKLHEEREQKGHEVVRNNVAAIKDLIDYIKKHLDE